MSSPGTIPIDEFARLIEMPQCPVPAGVPRPGDNFQQTSTP